VNNINRLLASLMTVVLSITFSAVSFTQNKESRIETVINKVVSIDTAKNELIIKKKSGSKKIFSADAKQIIPLNTCEWIKVFLKSGSNAAETIKKITKKHNKT